MTFNLWTFLFQTLNFVVLAFILHRLLYRPLQIAVTRRREAAEHVQAEAELARQQATMLQQQLGERLADLDRCRQEEMRKAVDHGATERQRLLAEIERTAERRRQDAHQALEQERAEAIQSLRDELTGMAVEFAERLLHEAADSTLHRQLTAQLLDKLDQLPELDRQRLRLDWQPDDEATIETAMDLDSSTLDQFRSRVSSVAGQHLNVSVQRMPSLLSGVRLRVGGCVWDASLASRLNEARQGRAGDNGS
jgi:F-type H+-transporting ATPase subunit b